MHKLWSITEDFTFHLWQYGTHSELIKMETSKQPKDMQLIWGHLVVTNTATCLCDGTHTRFNPPLYFCTWYIPDPAWFWLSWEGKNSQIWGGQINWVLPPRSQPCLLFHSNLLQISQFLPSPTQPFPSQWLARQKFPWKKETNYSWLAFLPGHQVSSMTWHFRDSWSGYAWSQACWPREGSLCSSVIQPMIATQSKLGGRSDLLNANSFPAKDLGFSSGAQCPLLPL